MFSLDFLTIPKENLLENLHFSSIWSLETVFSDIDTQWQVFSHSKSECLMKPIQMLLPPNQKIFSEFSSAFSESLQNFYYLELKRWASEVICFWNYRLQKAGLLKCPKSRVSEHLCKLNMLKGPKHCIMCTEVFLSQFLSTLKENQLEKLTWLEVFSLSKSECLT